MNNRLVIFTRYPEPGTTKTRLIPVLGPEGAANLQRQMTERTLRMAGDLQQKRRVSIEVRYEGGTDRLLRDWLGDDLRLKEQGRGDLGERMARAFRESFGVGDSAVVLVGSDCPEITPDVLQAAFHALAEADLVLGPASDGGYYLVGLRRSIPHLFVGIRWGDSEVLDKTLQIATEQHLSVRLLEELHDVDRPEDLWVWEQANRALSPTPSLSHITIVIPALNEAPNIAAALASAGQGEAVDIVVVDGGSTDGTPEIARSCGARVIQGPRCRAAQMNLGAAEATGDLLLFLHADTILPEGFDRQVREILAQPGVVAGAFLLAIDAPGLGLRLLECGANWRSRRLQMPWGDQGIFIRADRFRQAGGFPEIPIMEDFEFVWRLRRKGRVALAPVAVRTSARRWRNLGFFRTWLINRLMVFGYLLGVSPARLARWYGRKQNQ